MSHLFRFEPERSRNICNIWEEAGSIRTLGMEGKSNIQQVTTAIFGTV